MYLRQKVHNPPYVHAIYGEYIGMFSLSDGEMFEGDIPSKEQKAVQAFVTKYPAKRASDTFCRIARYGKELLNMWETQELMTLEPIE